MLDADLTVPPDDASNGFSKVLLVILIGAPVVAILVLAYCFVFRLPIGAPLLAVASLTTFCTQVIEAHHDWPTYRTATKKTSRVLVLSFLIVTALFAVLNAKVSWDSRPRAVDRISEWQMHENLAKFKGTSVQVVASGLSNYSDACALKFQIEDILKGAGWATQMGECNRFPAQFGSTIIIEFDMAGAAAANELFGYIQRQHWTGVASERTPDGRPMLPKLGVNPFIGDSGILLPGARPIDVLVQVYDNVR